MKRLIVLLAATIVVVGCTGANHAVNPTGPSLDTPAVSAVIHGIVSEMVDGVRQPSADASIDASLESTHRLAKSDADGNFVLEGLSVGAWTLTVTKPGFAPLVIRLDVAANMSDSSLDLALDPAETAPSEPVRRPIRR